MPCPPVKELLVIVERGEIPTNLSGHLTSCEACQGVVATLRDESEGLSFTIGDLWVRERISCPHGDILLAFVNGALDKDEAEFISFHLKTVGCGPCTAAVAELEEDHRDKKAKERVRSAMEKSLDRSRAYLARPQRD